MSTLQTGAVVVVWAYPIHMLYTYLLSAVVFGQKLGRDPIAEMRAALHSVLRHRYSPISEKECHIRVMTFNAIAKIIFVHSGFLTWNRFVV